MRNLGKISSPLFGLRTPGGRMKGGRGRGVALDLPWV